MANLRVGSGCTQKRKELIQKKLSGRGHTVYKALLERTKEVLTDVVGKQMTAITKQVKEVFREIRADLDSLFMNGDNNTKEVKAVKEKLYAMVPRAKEVLKNELVPLLEQCDQFRLRSG